MKNQTFQCSAWKSIPLMDCSCWDIHVQKIWGSEIKLKVGFIDFKVAAYRICGAVGFKCLGLVID